MIDLFSQAVLLVDMPANSLTKGDVGVVVEIYGDHEGYELEFMTKDGRTVAVETFMADQVRPISGRDMWHVREVAEVTV
jgi:hypothetical protein